jgi:hypothetical protein
VQLLAPDGMCVVSAARAIQPPSPPSCPTPAGEQATSVDAFAHELGHNLFLDHASTGADEYGDMTSAMGYCCADRCYNAPQMYQLGWTKPVADLNSAKLTSVQSYNVSCRVPYTQTTVLLSGAPYMLYRQRWT